MANPSTRGGEDNLRWTELHSVQVCEALSKPGCQALTFRMLDRWTKLGLVEAESFRQGTRIHATGSGTYRSYRYRNILQASLVNQLHIYQKGLDEIKEDLLDVPEGYPDWGSIIAVYDPAHCGEVFSAVGVKGEGLDIIREEAELLGALAADISCVHINLSVLKEEADQGIRRVLSTG